MPAPAADSDTPEAPPARRRIGRTIDHLIAEEERRFLERQPRSHDFSARASESLAGGATSSWQIARPATVWISHGCGSKVYDVDGAEYVDLHGGYGAMIAGHAHPAVVDAVSRRVRRGTHFAQPTEDAFVVSENLAERFGLPLWRFGNSGSEATMDAVHLMRAATGCDLIVKIEGSYHGHHDTVMVSYYNEIDELGPRRRPLSVLAGTGIPQVIADLTVVVPFNDLEVLAAVLDEHRGRIAGMIMEPMMMNAGIVPPEPGYLEGVRRLTREHDVLLTFDEVKTGLTVGPGGATALLGVQPDIVCLAKALGGGVPCGAIGGTAEVMELVVDGTYQQVGTFNGNPLTMAAARAMLTEILTPDAYAHFDLLGEHMRAASTTAFRRAGIPAYVRRYGAKGAIVFHPSPVRDYREFLSVHGELSHAHWLVQHNNGVFLPPWGKSEQWTLSVQHTKADADRFIDNVNRFAETLSSLDRWVSADAVALND
jgi:glutamate-1-semialdehyde 2,1-aminomutase